MSLYSIPNLRLILADKLELVGGVPTRKKSLEQIFTWIKASFDATEDGGSSAYYHLIHGWKNSYPETTGYLVPTLYEYAEVSGESVWKELADRAVNWLVEIQLDSGGWIGGQVGGSNEPRVFNTGMILDGMVDAYERTQDDRFLSAAIRGYNWICSTLDEKGLFSEFNVSGGGSFDLLTIGCMKRVEQYIGKNHDPLEKSITAHMAFQTQSAWWERCNFEGSYSSTALLHHLGYTLDGLLIIHEIDNRPDCLELVKATSSKLLSLFEVNNKLPAYTTDDWKCFYDLDGKTKKYSLCLTGNAQIAIVFLKLAALTNDLRFSNAAHKLIDINAAIANRRFGSEGLNHGLAGSFPVTGNYQKVQIVNWAAKYHAESILLEQGKSKPRKHGS